MFGPMIGTSWTHSQSKTVLTEGITHLLLPTPLYRYMPLINNNNYCCEEVASCCEEVAVKEFEVAVKNFLL